MSTLLYGEDTAQQRMKKDTMKIKEITSYGHKYHDSSCSQKGQKVSKHFMGGAAKTRMGCPSGVAKKGKRE